MHRYTVYENNIRATRNYTPEKKNNLDKEMLIFFVNLADFKGKT
jgi:hypothetical protein